MRKTYQKPMAAIENFTLTEFIASCGTVANLTGHIGCTNTNADLEGTWIALAIESSNLFTSSIDACRNHPGSGTVDFGMGDGMKICYHTSSEAINIFNS